MLKSGAAREQVVGDVEYMIGFVTGQMHLELRTDEIDALREPKLFDHLLTAIGPPAFLHSTRSANSIEWRTA